LKAETVPLCDAERDQKREADIALAKLRCDKETKLVQRAKVKHIQEGDNNTKYFHLIANGKHRKKRIFHLEQDEGTIVGQQNLKVFITEYYKKLFGAPVTNFFNMREEVTHDIPQLSEEENSFLQLLLQKRRLLKLSPIWNTIKLQDQIGFLLSFIKSYSSSLSLI
jgi:hypothetical protein